MASIQTAIMLTDRVTNPMRNICNALNMTISNFERLQEASGDSMNNIKFGKIREEINQANAAMVQLSDEINNAANKQNGFNNNVNNGQSKMGSLVNKVKQLVTAYAGIQTIKFTFGASDELSQMSARISMMNDGTQTTDQLMKQIYASAQDSRGSFQSMSELVARIGNNAKDAFSSNQEVIAFSNVIQKQMNLAGASTQEASSAIIQLSQGLGSGVLRGEELNSVFEQAPNIIQSIADYLNVPIGKIRTMAAEGQLTSDIVKNAVLSSADEVNRKFNEMPMTWSQVWTSMKNTALVRFQPVLDKINQLANSKQFQEFANNAIGAMAMVATITLTVFDAMASVGTWVADNWSILSPIIYGVVAALGIYMGVLLAYNAMTGIAAVLTATHAAATMLEEGATFSATAAQYGFNAALYACPLTWIVVAILLVVAAYFAVIAAINKVTGAHISAVGVITGVIATAGAFIYNTIVGVLNAILQFVYSSFVEPNIRIIEWMLNVMNGGFDSFGDAVKNLLGQIIGWFLNLGKVVTKIIDAIFGTDWTAGLNNLQNNVTAWGKNKNAIKLSTEAPQIPLKRIQYKDAYSKGYEFGSKIQNKISSKLNSLKNIKTPKVPDASKYAKKGLTPAASKSAQKGLAPAAAKTANNTKKTADNTKAMKDALDITSDNIKYIRDFATQKAINRYTATTIKVEMTNNNSLNSDADIDGIVNKLRTRLEEEMIASAEGVY